MSPFVSEAQFIENIQQIKKWDKKYHAVSKHNRNVVSTAALWRKGIQACLHSRRCSYQGVIEYIKPAALQSNITELQFKGRNTFCEKETYFKLGKPPIFHLSLTIFS